MSMMFMNVAIVNLFIKNTNTKHQYIINNMNNLILEYEEDIKKLI